MLATKEPSGARGGHCPICRKAAQPAFRPFCSKRCADIDLGRWLGGGYVVAGATRAEEDGGASEPPPAKISTEDDQS